MELLGLELDWQRWFERWEAMQNCYIPHRLERFDLMLKLAGLPTEDESRILDLGCGPGSLSFLALQRYANARILAVDFDRILLKIGDEMAKAATTPGRGPGRPGDRIQFRRLDIRDGGWWTDYRETFDLVVSATALHWLSAEHLAQAFQQIYEVLKPGGWFFNSDHVASDEPKVQARYRELLQQKQRAAFQATKADDWEGFWEKLGKELSGPAEGGGKHLDLSAVRDIAQCWEGTEDGQPMQYHLTELRQCGFQHVEVFWQELGEAVIGARKRS